MNYVPRKDLSSKSGHYHQSHKQPYQETPLNLLKLKIFNLQGLGTK
jgi:hypothetical protein